MAQFEEILDAVKKELKQRLKLKKIDDYDNIPFDTIKGLLEEDDILIYGEFKESLTTPWAVARYIKLYLEEKELIVTVTADINKFIPKNIEFVFIKHLSCNIQFMKTFEEGVKRQILIVKYYLDEDDRIQYKLTNAGSSFCWDVTKPQLKALLSNEIIINEKTIDTSLQPKKISAFKKWLKKILGL